MITDDTFRRYGGTDLTSFDAKPDSDPSAARAYRVLRKSTVTDLAEKIGKDTNCDPKLLRIWSMVNRQNKTVRPDVPFTDPATTMEEAQQKSTSNKALDLRLWAELAEEVAPDGNAIWPTFQVDLNGNTPKSDLIVLFLKWFDIGSQTLNGVGHIYVSREKKVEDLVPAILSKVDWPELLPNGERLQLRLYEVRKPFFSSSQISNRHLGN